MTTEDATDLTSRAKPAGEPSGCGTWLQRAPAKLNLALRVGPRRGDGFHDVDSVVATVTLYDELTLRPRTDGQVRLRCTGADCGPDETNLAYRAAKLLTAEAGGIGADVELTKRIPPGAGLGGGSSDAAATLAALNTLLGLRMSGDRLAQLAAELGSDVPLFLAGPTTRMRGRGERVEPADVHPFWAVLHMPDLACPTAAVYAAFDDLVGGRAGPAEPDMARFALPPSEWGDAVVNDLASAAVRACPALVGVIDRLARAAGRAVHVSGSGSGLFILADDETEAAGIAATLDDADRRRCRIVTLNPW